MLSAARLGAERELIVTALGITADQLRDPEFIQHLQQTIARGHALHEIELLGDVRRLRKGGEGKVNAVLASLKHRMGWNTPDSNKNRNKERPDAAAAVAELERMLKRVR